MPLVLSELPSCPGPSLPSLPSSCSAALTGLSPPFPRCWCSLEAELLPSGQLLGKCHPSLSQLHVPTHFILPRGSPIPLGTIPRGCGDPFSLPSCHRPQPWPLSEPTMSSLQLGSLEQPPCAWLRAVRAGSLVLLGLRSRSSLSLCSYVTATGLGRASQQNLGGSCA